MSDAKIIIITQGVSRIVKPLVNQFNVVGIIEDSTKKILNTCKDIKKPKKKIPTNTFLRQQKPYDLFNFDKKNNSNNEFIKLLN